MAPTIVHHQNCMFPFKFGVFSEFANARDEDGLNVLEQQLRILFDDQIDAKSESQHFQKVPRSIRVSGTDNKETHQFSSR
jgi:hypothetical protein